MSVDGSVFNIQRFSLHDGPGIRTTVFLKGCPLRCLWCHNPEGYDARPQIRLTTNLCTRCGRCVAVCAPGGHVVTPDGHTLHLAGCTRCGHCVDACYAGALEMVGSRMTVEEVLAVVRRDVPFYQNSGGGMTLSGGEPLMQFAFSQALLEGARAEAMHTAIETTAFAPWERLQELRPLVDLFLVDLKHTDDARHQALTGVSNTRILEHIRRMMYEAWPMILRIPWVPTMNADDLFLEGLEAFVTAVPRPPLVEFMPYHRLGIGKWTALGGESPIDGEIPAATPEQIAPWAERLRAHGIEVKVG